LNSGDYLLYASAADCNLLMKCCKLNYCCMNAISLAKLTA